MDSFVLSPEPMYNFKDDVYNPDVDQMVNTLQTALMTRPGKGLGPEYYSFLCHVLEAHRAMRGQIERLESQVKEALNKRIVDHEDFDRTAMLWSVEREKYRAEVKRLEILLSKGSEGMEAVMLARAGSLIRKEDGVKLPSRPKKPKKPTVIAEEERARPMLPVLPETDPDVLVSQEFARQDNDAPEQFYGSRPNQAHEAGFMKLRFHDPKKNKQGEVKGKHREKETGDTASAPGPAPSASVETGDGSEDDDKPFRLMSKTSASRHIVSSDGTASTMAMSSRSPAPASPFPASTSGGSVQFGDARPARSRFSTTASLGHRRGFSFQAGDDTGLSGLNTSTEASVRQRAMRIDVGGQGRGQKPLLLSPSITGPPLLKPSPLSSVTSSAPSSGPSSPSADLMIEVPHRKQSSSSTATMEHISSRQSTSRGSQRSSRTRSDASVIAAAKALQLHDPEHAKPI
ncbi:MAG: hypothetical protein M1838_004041 [Thelocarpon superellum]|nr:MAG: hypothetical protein M1838_004041 [Thelocarpon superellum]